MMRFWPQVLKRFGAIVCILFAQQTVSAQSWMYQNSGLAGSHIRPVKAVDEQTVWAGAENGLTLRTTNGGTNWTVGRTGAPSGFNFLSIAAIDADTAYFAGAHISTTDTRIYKTTDGGLNWKMQYQNTSPNAFINSIAFWDATHGIAVSDAVGGAFLILTTSNGGANWNQTSVLNIPSPISTHEFAGFGDTGGTSLAVAGSNHAWFGTAYEIASSAPVRVFKSTDRGQTWTVTNTPLAIDGQYYGITTMAFQDTLNGFAGSSSGSGAGNTLARTTDGGKTWSLVSSFVQTQSQIGTLVYVPQTDFQVLVASTLGGTVYSDNGGATWTRLSSDIFSGLSFVSPSAGWAGFIDGRIARFVGDFTTGVVKHDSAIPSAFHLAQNYPNPFGSEATARSAGNPTTTTIQYEIPQSVQVKLTIYNLLGEKIRTLVDATESAGVRKTIWDGRNELGQRVASGVYLYRLEAGEFTTTKRLVVMR